MAKIATTIEEQAAKWRKLLEQRRKYKREYRKRKTAEKNKAFWDNFKAKLAK